MAIKISTLAFVLLASTSGWANCAFKSGKDLFAKSAATSSSSSSKTDKQKTE